MEGSNKRHNKYINIKQLNVTQIVLIQFNHHWLSGQRITNSRLLCVTILFHHLVYVCVLHLNCIYLLHYPLKCQPHMFTYQSPSHSFSFHLHNLPHSFLFLLFYFYFYIRFHFLLYITTDTNSKPII